MTEIFDFWFYVWDKLVLFILYTDTGLGFNLGHLIIASLIFVVVIRYFTVIGN